jgi:uncharacterized protein YegL
MIIFPQDPVWFSLKIIKVLRNNPKCSYKPSIRQALAICKLIISRFLNRGQCNEEDYIEIAVVTSPLENQQLVRKIATELLTYYKTVDRSKINGISSNIGLFNDDLKPQELVNELETSLDNLDSILDDFDYLDKVSKEEDLESLDWEKEYYSYFDEFIQKHFDILQNEPYKTALKFIEDNEITDFNKFQTPDDLLRHAKDLLEEKINSLEPDDINTAKTLDLLDQIIVSTEKVHEKVSAQLAKDKNLDEFQKKLQGNFKNDIFQILKIIDFVLKSNILDDSGNEMLKSIFEDFLKDMNSTIEDLFEATKTFGENLDLEEEIINQIIDNSLDIPFKEAYNNLKSIDRFFGGDILDTYLDKVKENLDKVDISQDVKDSLIRNPTKTSSWRELLEKVVSEELDEIETQNEGSEELHQYFKNYTDDLIRSQQNCEDPTAKMQINQNIKSSINKALNHSKNKDEFIESVNNYKDLGFDIDPDLIREIGSNLKMTDEEILQLIASNYEDLKKMVQSNSFNYQDYKAFLKRMDLSFIQVEDLAKIALSKDPENLPALTALSEEDLSTVLNTASRMGMSKTEAVISSLGAGSGLDLLEQWFYSRHNISIKVKERIKQLIKQIMIDLGIKSANSLIGSGNSGPLVENTVVPYNPGDSFELIDLEDTISNILESGKSLKMITEDDFLVSKTSQGLRSIVLELDISGSMMGEKLAQMALCTTMLVYAFEPEELAISFFESNTHKLKNIEEDVSLELIVDELLDISARGGTCIREALNWANKQFETKARSKSRLNILFTDADVFDYSDSIAELKKMKDLGIRFVMVVPKFNYSPVMAKRMVKSADGVLLTLDQWRDFLKLISEIVSKTSL